MAAEAVATVLSRRCPRCNGFYPFDAEHVCTGDAGAPTLAAAPPVSAAAGPSTQPLGAPTVPMPASGSAPNQAVTIEQPPDGTPTAPGSAAPAGPPAVPVNLVGLTLGERYEIVERLSAGGMGVVYRGRHTLLDSPVAVKVLLKPQDPQAQRRFLVEAKLASAIRHPNTVYISDFGVLPDGRSYLVMEFLQGPTLGRLLRGGRLDPLRACTLAVQIAEGLQAVHARGIVHRDLKPDEDGLRVLRRETVFREGLAEGSRQTCERFADSRARSCAS